MGILDKIKAINNAGLMSFSLTQEQIQKNVEIKFPLTYEKYFSTLTLSDPKVIICEKSNKVGIEVKAITKIPFIGEKTGAITIKGGLHVSKEKKTVYLNTPEIVNLSIEGTSDDSMEAIRALAQATVEKTLEQIPIYELSGAVSARTVKSIAIKDGKLHVSVGL